MVWHKMIIFTPKLAHFGQKLQDMPEMGKRVPGKSNYKLLCYKYWMRTRNNLLEVLKIGSHLLQNKPQIGVPMVPFLTMPRQRVLLRGKCCFKSLKWTGADLGVVESNDRIYSQISPFNLKLVYQVNYPTVDNLD